MATEQIYNGDWDDFCKIQRINPEFHNDGMYFFINHKYNGCWCTTRCSFSDKDADHLWLTITRKGNNTLGRLYPYEPYIFPSDIETMVEAGTDYSNRLKQLSNLSFDGIRNSSRSYIMKLPKETRDLLYEELKRGTTIIGMDYLGGPSYEEVEVVPIVDDYELMEEFVFAYGKMHHAKLSFAFQELYNYYNSQNGFEHHDSIFHKKEINIVDYGCGQALGTICYADYLRKKGINQYVNTITLIEPSALSLKRAALHVSLFFPDAKIITINKTIKDLNSNDICCFEDTPTLHLFSNILDVLDANEISNLQTIIDKTISGFNQFVCVGPLLGDHSIDSFSSQIGGRKNVIEGKRDKYKLVSTENWTCEYSCFTIDQIRDLSNEAEYQYNRGMHYKYGYVAERNMKKAWECFEKAAELECAKAQYELGMLYTEVGSMQDDSKAIIWFERSAKNGCEAALVLLANRYFNSAIRHVSGKGKDRDLFKAYLLFKKASLYGNREAALRIEHVDPTFTYPQYYSVIKIKNVNNPIPYKEFKELCNQGLPINYRRTEDGFWYSIVYCPINKEPRMIPIYSREVLGLVNTVYYTKFCKKDNNKIFGIVFSEKEPK